ncbi:MAG: putative lipid II flippase FtsW [Nitriliruptorales bacterium]|nr:putative lipid II flippase FtsW [Nitriliruptorales bacterium]
MAADARATRSRRRPPAVVRASRPVSLRPEVGGDTTPEFITVAVVVSLLLLAGLVMTFSASFVQSTVQTGNAFGIFGKQLLWSAVGLPLLVATAITDYRRWRPVARGLLAVSLIAAVVVVIPGIGVEVNGARRWLELGPLRFQPTEMLKLTVPLYLAHVLAGRWRRLRGGDLHALLIPAVPLVGVVGVLVMLEPDLETALLLAAIVGIVLLAAGLPGRIVAGLIAALGLLGLAGVATSDYRRGRFLAWLDPMSDASNFGYQTVQGYYALASGGWTGAGLGQGRGKWLYIPNAHTDYIFAIIGEETGLLGATAILVLFAALAVGGTRTARYAPDPFGRLLAASITGWLLVQATINIGSVVGLLPVTGVTLPLVSFGGSSLVFTMLGIGMLLSISRAARHGSTARGEGAR